MGWSAVTVSVSLAVLSVASSGCRKPNTPEQAYVLFTEAVERGDEKAAYEALSEKTRQDLQRRAEEISKASGGSVKADPAGLMFTFTGRPSGVTKVSMVSLEGDRAVVKVTSGGST